MAARHLYSGDELALYFDRVALPETRRHYRVHELPDDDKLAFLNLLQKHQLVKVPWENLTQHYSWHRTVNVRPAHLFHKIVRDPGRGGYCMEANHFFHTVLLSLGFDVYMTGARIYRGPQQLFGGWTHMVNIVTIAGTKYLLDGGLGPNGPTHPLPIVDGATAQQIRPAQMRLTFETLAQHLDRSQKAWVYAYRFDESREWTPAYCFTDVEFFPDDIVSMNFSPWLSPQTFFTQKIVCVRFTTETETQDTRRLGSPDEHAIEGEINGTMTINDDVFKWRKNGAKVEEITFQSEQDRIKAFEKYFGIVISQQDRDSIIGTSAQVGPTPNPAF